MKRRQAESKEDSCAIGADPLQCWVRAGCRYWNRGLRSCTYRAAKDAERKRRREEAADGSAVMDRIKIDRR